MSASLEEARTASFCLLRHSHRPPWMLSRHPSLYELRWCPSSSSYASHTYCLRHSDSWSSVMQVSSVNLRGLVYLPDDLLASCSGRGSRSKAKQSTARLICCQVTGTFVKEDTKSGKALWTGTHAMSPAEQRVLDVVLKQASLVNHRLRDADQGVAKPGIVGRTSTGPLDLLGDAFLRCGEVCEEYAKTFYLGTLLMTPERRKAVWAIYVWCRRTDELVDGPNAPHITPSALDRWEQRLEDVFQGKPYDMFDAALADTVMKFPIDIQPFRDMINGMRMDLVKARYDNFDELYLYCYYVAGTVGLMSVPVMGIAPDSKATTESVFNAALALGIANQLTNILRDVGEDARRGRVYLPRDELAQFGLSEKDIFAGQVNDKWRDFMKNQINRARMFFDISEKGVGELDRDSRWPVWASLTLYRQILDSIEANDYDNFTKRAYVGRWKKFLFLPSAYLRALVPPPSAFARGSKSVSVKS